MDHREDSTFSFDPSNLNVKKLTKHKLKKIDARKGVLLSSYTRKKTRRRKRGAGRGNAPSPSRQPQHEQEAEPPKRSRSVTPSPSPSPRHGRPQHLPLPLPPPRHVQTANTLAPGGNRLAPHSRQTSSEGGNRESSLDDSGVVDDHEEGDATSEDAAQVGRVRAAGGALGGACERGGCCRGRSRRRSRSRSARRRSR